jgi:hypothetical protein
VREKVECRQEFGFLRAKNKYVDHGASRLVFRLSNRNLP